MNKFTEKQIRAVRGKETNHHNHYWVYAELLIDEEWKEPFFVHKEKLKWHEPKRELYPNVENMQKYISEELKYINKLLEEGWEIVNYDQYKEVVHQYHYPLDYTPKVVYL